MAAVAHLFDVAQLLDLSAEQLNSLSESQFRKLADEIKAFDEIKRRRVWHLAYERQHERISAGISKQLSKHLLGDFFLLYQYDGVIRPGNIPVVGTFFRYTL